MADSASLVQIVQRGEQLPEVVAGELLVEGASVLEHSKEVSVFDDFHENIEAFEGFSAV